MEPSSAGERIKQMWCRYRIKAHSAVRKNRIVSFARKWMGLEIIIKVSQTQTNITCFISYVQPRFNYIRVKVEGDTLGREKGGGT